MLNPFLLFNPVEYKRHVEAELRREKQRYEFTKRQGVVAWDIDMKIPRESLVIDGTTFTTGFSLFDVPPTEHDVLYAHEAPPSCVQHNLWRYGHVIIPKERALDLPVYPGRDRQPEVFFTTDVVVPTLAEYTDEYRWRVWMSMTPAEIFSQRSGIKFCRGNVVIGGLGMGWFMTQVVKRKQVKKVVVVEKSRDLLDWYGEKLCKTHGVEVICDDVWNVVGKQPAGTRYALDIWKGFFDARWDHRLRKAREAGHDIWAWGSARGGD